MLTCSIHDQKRLESVISSAVRLRYPVRQGWRDACAHELALSLITAHGVRQFFDREEFPSTEAAATELARQDHLVWGPVEDILQEADFAVEIDLPRDAPEEEKRKRWALPTVSRLDVKDPPTFTAPAMDELGRCAVAYMRASWANSPTLETWLMRQMIFVETHAFSRQANMPEFPSKAGVAWRIAKALGIWAVALLSSADIGERHGAGMGFLAFAMWFAFMVLLDWRRQLPRLPHAKAFLAMRSTLSVALRSPASPLEIEAAARGAEASGAVWPHGFRMLLARASRRSAELCDGMS